MIWATMIGFWKSIPVCYRLVQPFPPEYFRQEIPFCFKLRIAGRYLLRQGLFYSGLFFIGTGSPALLVGACNIYRKTSNMLYCRASV